MDFEILAESTTPLLDLDTLRLRDPVCRPAYRSPLNDRVRFHVPLNGCGTRHWVSVARAAGGGIQALAMPSLMLSFTCSLMGSRFIMRMR